jgi:hypothetical protein
VFFVGFGENSGIEMEILRTSLNQDGGKCDLLKLGCGQSVAELKKALPDCNIQVQHDLNRPAAL